MGELRSTPDGTPGGASRLADLIAGQARQAPGQVWVEHARTGRTVDRAGLADLAGAWQRQDLAGSRIGLPVADPVSFAGLFVALMSAGATVVPVDATAPAAAIRGVLEAAGVTDVVRVAGEAAGPPAGTRVIEVDSGLMPAYPGRGPVPAEEGACLLFSSGSTGPRKAIRLPVRQLVYVARCVVEAHGLTDADRCYNPLPLFHVNAEVVALLGSLVSGGTAVLDPGFHRTGFWPLVAERSITWINAVPAVIAVLAQEPDVPSGAPPVRFVRSASAPLAASVLERFEGRYGIPVVESYGMTEAASQITANPLTDRRPGSVGLPVGVDLRVVDSSGAAAGVGDVGRVLVRGAGVITGYESDGGTGRFDPEGWLDTGDLGARDEDGYLYLAGRAGEVINRGGEKIFPREIEEVLRAEPAVRDAVVIGRDDDVLGAVPVAYVVTDAGDADRLVRELTQRCLEVLPRTHRPAAIQVVPSLPVGPTGKTVRRLVAAQDAAGRAAARS